MGLSSSSLDVLAEASDGHVENTTRLSWPAGPERGEGSWLGGWGGGGQRYCTVALSAVHCPAGFVLCIWSDMLYLVPATALYVVYGRNC